jgi:hypothetical protein
MAMVGFRCGVWDSYDVLVVNSGCGVYSEVGVINVLDLSDPHWSCHRTADVMTV